MQLIFLHKDEKLSIEIRDGVSTIAFNYVEMIKKFLKEKELEETIFDGEFTDEEKEKINEMVDKINKAIPHDEFKDND